MDIAKTKIQTKWERVARSLQDISSLSRRRKYKLSSCENLSRSQEDKLNSYKNLSRSQDNKLNSCKNLSRSQEDKLNSYMNLSRSQEDKLNSYKNLSRSQEDKLSSYKNLSRRKKDKLNTFLEELVTEAGFDFSCPEIQEIQDIQSAVSEMIERIKTGINERGIFSISRTEICGSMAEKTAMWKRSWTVIPYIEFDFLAVLQAACDIMPCCQECFYVNTPPMNLDLLEEYYRGLYMSYLKNKHERKNIVEECFTRETNNCLASCGCQEVIYKDQGNWRGYTFEPSSTCSKTQQGCDKCTVDRPTGTLRVKTSVKIGGRYTEIDCTLVFQWTSKAKTLCTRNRVCLPKTEKMYNLTIHIDFLPALELFQSKQHSADVAACSSSGLVLNPTSSEDEHYCFLVAKHCVVCDEYITWRRSGCRAEIDTIVNKMSDKHRTCYRVLKHLTGFTPDLNLFNNYHIKVAVLHHNSSCSDAGEDCAKCVYKVLDQLLHAYETRQLKSLHSQANLLEPDNLVYKYCNSIIISALQRKMCSAVSKSDSVSSFLEKFENLHQRI